MVNLKDWQEINIGNDTTLKARIGWQGLTTGEYKDSGEYYLVTGTDFENGFVNWDTCHFVDKWRFDQDKNIQLKVNDVLITKDGTIGKAGFIDTIKLPTTLNSGVFVIRTNSNKLDQKYLYYIFTSEIFVEFLNRLTAGSTINHLYQKDFVHFTFKAPKLEEQKAIAKALSDTDELITTLEKLISKKEAIKQGTMQQLLTGKKRLSGFSGDREEKRLGEVIKLQGGYAFQSNKFRKQGIKVIRISNIQDSNIDLDDVVFYDEIKIAKDFQVIKNDILIAMSGATTGKVGKYLEQNFSYLNQRVGKLVTLNENQNDKDFIYYLSISNEFTSQLIKMLAQGAQPNISGKQIESMIFNFPKKEEQKAIAQILSDMDNEIETLKQKLSKTKAIKDGIMSELLTGKTRLKVKDE
ncbi:restriction endonuclease subunit S [Aliarcobacter skirrowii]|uniref:restriction endonuclease subunit S n=1 Tax=Aliarcobacter skirrowii TaxID=28200 RepID=UPI0029BD2A4B|nr:restriction endonuclease subunit S [Aliarcobacter skirrowii]MDX4028581.1 restriction endonuclease subunit S [Aliarcobacter skirrowii]